ncbi:type VI secretion system ImpA family N-terminal domain-containing protein [Vibrio sp. TRT 17S01]|uniref:type VI secretion system ImpA family N-terminal domain-containing protein n=1 Tax=Vibrio sp. TRT 17S01 TaxID=3418505 RepID=UPI003CEE4A8B
MSNILFIDQVPFHIVDDTASLRDQSTYQRVREEINRRNGPFGGSIDWEKVKADCEMLASGPGIDLLLCGYYVVACLKTSGLAGYVNALELLSLGVSRADKPDSKTAKMRKEVLDWMNARVVRELKDLKPDYHSLRDLYRCENYFDRIFLLIEHQQPEYQVDFEGVAFAVFEHIDRIETKYHSLVKVDEEHQAEVLRKGKAKQRWWLAGCFLLGIGSVFGTNAIYQNTPWFHEISFQQQLTTPNLAGREQALHYLSIHSQESVANEEQGITTLYSESIGTLIDSSVELPLIQAQQQLEVLNTLFPDSELTQQAKESVALSKEQALLLTSQFIERFQEIRTRMANISLLAKKERWRELQRQTKSLEDFAVSLSPVYGRVGYVQDLIEQGDYDQAQMEFSVLKERLNSLSWKVVELEERLALEQRNGAPSEILPEEQ